MLCLKIHLLYTGLRRLFFATRLCHHADDQVGDRTLPTLRKDPRHRFAIKLVMGFLVRTQDTALSCNGAYVWSLSSAGFRLKYQCVDGKDWIYWGQLLGMLLESIGWFEPSLVLGFWVQTGLVLARTALSLGEAACGSPTPCVGTVL